MNKKVLMLAGLAVVMVAAIIFQTTVSAPVAEAQWPWPQCYDTWVDWFWNRCWDPCPFGSWCNCITCEF